MQNPRHPQGLTLSIEERNFRLDIPTQHPDRVGNHTDMIDHRLAGSHHLMILIAVPIRDGRVEEVIVGLASQGPPIVHPQEAHQGAIGVDETATSIFDEDVRRGQMVHQRQQRQRAVDSRKKRILLFTE